MANDDIDDVDDDDLEDGESHQGVYGTDQPGKWRIGKWQGDLLPTQRDLDFVSNYSNNNTVVSDFIRVFGTQKLPWGNEPLTPAQQNDPNYTWATIERHNTALRNGQIEGAPLPVPRNLGAREANKTPKQLERLDAAYPDQTTAIMRAYRKQHQQQIEQDERESRDALKQMY